MNRPKEYTVQQVSEMLASPSPPRLVDVREPAEYELVHLEGGQLLTEALVDEILNQWPKDTFIVCYCHHGMRSLNAAMFFASKGFSNIGSMRGGIDVWAREIDPSLALY
jgi:rhodanese-related sulfurtransferase